MIAFYEGAAIFSDLMLFTAYTNALNANAYGGNDPVWTATVLDAQNRRMED